VPFYPLIKIKSGSSASCNLKM